MVQGAPHSGLHRRRRLNPSALTDLKHHRGPPRLRRPDGTQGPRRAPGILQPLRRAIMSESDTAAGKIRTRLRIWPNLDTTARFHINPCKVCILAQTRKPVKFVQTSKL